jgi:hypothetical protein
VQIDGATLAPEIQLSVRWLERRGAQRPETQSIPERREARRGWLPSIPFQPPPRMPVPP